MQKLSLPAEVERMEEVLDFIHTQLEPYDMSMKTEMQIDIAVEEVFVNIAHYAYAPGVGEATVCVEVEEANRCAVIRFMDAGKPYDPLSREDPDVTLSVEEREVGGLGIFMVKKSMDEVSYAYEDGQNILTIRKRL